MTKLVRSPLLAVLFLTAATLLQAGTFNSLPTFLANTSGLTLIEGDHADVPIGAVSPPNGWFNNNFVGEVPFFRANFNVNAGTVTAVGVHHVLSSGPIADLTAYDAGGNSLATVASNGDTNTMDFFGVTTSSPINYFTVAWRSLHGYGLDDLYFGGADGTPGVPEPGSLGLASAGILAGILALAARRG